MSLLDLSSLAGLSAWADLPALAETAVVALYYLVLGVLALYGLHRSHLVYIYAKSRKQPVPAPAEPAEWPRVTVQLPLYNEMYVAGRLIDAVCRLDYPRDRLEIQVLDDSTDETTEIAAEAVERYAAEGVEIRLLHRDDRTGFKAGALEAGLAAASGELVAVFDADFVPGEDFLRRAVPHFADPRVGMVQARWEHLNRDFSLLTRIQAILLDGHFRVEHTARHRSGCFFNFNGTAGIWRRRAIEDAGGWQHDTLTEDLDLSYRAQLAGWRFVYLPEVAVPSELPVEIHGFKSQQHRWAKGSVQTGRKLLGRVLRARLPLRVKLEALIHLTNNGAYPLMILLSLLVFPAMYFRRDAAFDTRLWVDIPLFLAATGSVLLFYAVSQRDGARGWLAELRFLPALMGLGIGLSVSNARAVAEGLVQRGGEFRRTPKYRIEGRGTSWHTRKYKAGSNASFVVEGALAFYLAFCIVVAAQLAMWETLPFLYLFLHGYTYMFALSVVPRLRRPAPGWAAARAS